MIRQFGACFPGGFFIYKAEDPEDLLYANQAVLRIFGCRDLDEFKALTGYTFKGMLHPDDYAFSRQSIEEQIASSEDRTDHVIYRIVRKDGAVRWIDDYGLYAETGDQGGVYYVFISDITEAYLRRKKNEALRVSVIDGLCDSYETVMLITDVDKEAMSLYKESATTPSDQVDKALSSASYSEAVRSYAQAMVDPEEREWFIVQAGIVNVSKNLADKKQFAMAYKRVRDGKTRYYRLEFIRISMPDGQMGIILGFKDIDEEFRAQRQLEQKLEQAEEDRLRKDEELSKAQYAALVDELTGVKNRRCLSMLQTSIDQKAKSGRLTEYAVVMCDLNDLKVVNDNFGHLAGDRYLQEASKIICHTFSLSPVFRIGGDEFCVVLTGHDFDHRKSLVSALSSHVHDNSITGGCIIASGMAEFRPDEDHGFRQVFDRADRNMYANKMDIKGGVCRLPTYMKDTSFGVRPAAKGKD